MALFRTKPKLFGEYVNAFNSMISHAFQFQNNKPLIMNCSRKNYSKIWPESITSIRKHHFVYWIELKTVDWCIILLNCFVDNLCFEFTFSFVLFQQVLKIIHLIVDQTGKGFAVSRTKLCSCELHPRNIKFCLGNFSICEMAIHRGISDGDHKCLVVII